MYLTNTPSFTTLTQINVSKPELIEGRIV